MTCLRVGKVEGMCGLLTGGFCEWGGGMVLEGSKGKQKHPWEETENPAKHYTLLGLSSTVQ